MSTMPFPTLDRLLIAPIATERTSKGGIIIPETAHVDPPRIGTVLLAGPGRYNDLGERLPMDVEAGNIVVYSQYGGTEITLDGVDYVVVSATEVLLVLPDVPSST